MEAHRAGCAFVKKTAMVACERPYPIVVTTNAGYPLDQNLYQAVKGMHAAMQVVEEDGLILAAAPRTGPGRVHRTRKRALQTGICPDRALPARRPSVTTQRTTGGVDVVASHRLHVRACIALTSSPGAMCPR